MGKDNKRDRGGSGAGARWRGGKDGSQAAVVIPASQHTSGGGQGKGYGGWAAGPQNGGWEGGWGAGYPAAGGHPDAFVAAAYRQHEAASASHSAAAAAGALANFLPHPGLPGYPAPGLGHAPVSGVVVSPGPGLTAAAAPRAFAAGGGVSAPNFRRGNSGGVGGGGAGAQADGERGKRGKTGGEARGAKGGRRGEEGKVAQDAKAREGEQQAPQQGNSGNGAGEQPQPARQTRKATSSVSPQTDAPAVDPAADTDKAKKAVASVTADASGKRRHEPAIPVYPPSRIVLLRRVAWDATQGMLVEAGKKFGDVQRVIMLRSKNHALIEFSSLKESQAMIDYYKKHHDSVLEMCGHAATIGYCKHQRWVAPEASKTLLTSLFDSTFRITACLYISPRLIYAMFAPYGAIEAVVVIPKKAAKNRVQALVQFANTKQAQVVKELMQGLPVWFGPRIQFALDLLYSKVESISCGLLPGSTLLVPREVVATHERLIEKYGSLMEAFNVPVSEMSVEQLDDFVQWRKILSEVAGQQRDELKPAMEALAAKGEMEPSEREAAVADVLKELHTPIADDWAKHHNLTPEAQMQTLINMENLIHNGGMAATCRLLPREGRSDDDSGGESDDDMDGLTAEGGGGGAAPKPRTPAPVVPSQPQTQIQAQAQSPLPAQTAVAAAAAAVARASMATPVTAAGMRTRIAASPLPHMPGFGSVDVANFAPYLSSSAAKDSFKDPFIGPCSAPAILQSELMSVCKDDLHLALGTSAAAAAAAGKPGQVANASAQLSDAGSLPGSVSYFPQTLHDPHIGQGSLGLSSIGVAGALQPFTLPFFDMTQKSTVPENMLAQSAQDGAGLNLEDDGIFMVM